MLQCHQLLMALAVGFFHTSTLATNPGLFSGSNYLLKAFDMHFGTHPKTLYEMAQLGGASGLRKTVVWLTPCSVYRSAVLPHCTFDNFCGIIGPSACVDMILGNYLLFMLTRTVFVSTVEIQDIRSLHRGKPVTCEQLLAKPRIQK